MTTKRRNSKETPAARWYRGADVPMRVIRRFAREVAERFQPDKIILFGSHAYGTPHADSDVDILVIMPAGIKHRRRCKFDWPATPLSRWTSSSGRPRTCAGDWRKASRSTRRSCPGARSCMKRSTREWVRKAEADYRAAKRLGAEATPCMTRAAFSVSKLPKNFSRHCWKNWEFRSRELIVCKTSFALLLPHHPSLRPQRRGLVFLTRFAVDTRYPGDKATKRDAVSALRWAGRVRDAWRSLLGV